MSAATMALPWLYIDDQTLNTLFPFIFLFSNKVIKIKSNIHGEGKMWNWVLADVRNKKELQKLRLGFEKDEKEEASISSILFTYIIKILNRWVKWNLTTFNLIFNKKIQRKIFIHGG